MNLLVLVVAISSASALYSSSDDVVELTASNFNREVIQSDGLVLVEFYAPWCGHCQQLAPEWKKAATALKGVVKIAAVNADEHQSLGGQYQIQGFPTIKVFGANKNSPSDYQGGRNADSIVDTALSKLKSLVQDRLKGRGGSGGRSSGGGKSGGGSADDVIELTDSNFEKLVLDSDDMWMVEFFAPWCGHCKNLAPHWQSAASEMKGKVKFGALDATVHSVMANRYGVRGYPSIKMFPSGKKDGEAMEYDGGRTSSDIVSWATEKLAENLPPPEVVQILSQDTIKENCEEKQLCVVAVLPHILDCQSKCRNNYIKILKDMGVKYKKQPWGWVWTEAGQQMQLEEALGMGGFGYPAMAAVNTRKQVFVLLKRPFSSDGINEYLRDLSYGKGSPVPLKDSKVATIEKTEAWDGKDGELPVEEDIDLSDIDLDDGKDEL
ncbi:protein disulfide-isomerase A6-like [Ostrea edulis]|uniref:protein disulfide-isomerase A6-like n=1 Tax=Ostrea edulis TaxID=37623 RepID=UPI0024AF8A1F|nr:protein disulfide-isomerase A6-like [Ostrea edulis]